VRDAFLDQAAALARQPALVFRVRAGRLDHGAHLTLPSRPGHERAHEKVAVDGVRLGPAVAQVHRDRGGIHNMARDPLSQQQAVEPEAVKPRFLDNRDRCRRTEPALSRGPQPR